MSRAERLYKARSLQGKLTSEQIAELKADLLRLLNTKEHPKSDTQLEQELVRFCGWNRRKIVGPRPYVYDCLDGLEREGLIESDSKYVGEFPEGYMRYSFWRVSQKEIQVDSSDSKSTS